MPTRRMLKQRTKSYKGIKSLRRPSASRHISRSRLVAVQQLLRTKGVFLSLPALRKVSRTNLIRYIRRHFTPEEVAPYLPPHLVFKNLSAKNIEKKNIASSSVSKEIPSLTDVPVKDINQPIYPSQEITSAEGQLLNRTIFAFEDDHTFDPGLWESLARYLLPPEYSIPDQKFVAVLSQAAKKYGLGPS